MKKLLLTLLAAAAVMCADAQNKPKSPKTDNSAKIGGVDVSVVYSAPSARGRKVMGELVPFGKVWRTGANEPTTIEFSQDVTIEGQAVPAGKYALFTIPGEKEWVIILNSDYKQWGAMKYTADKDIIRVKVKPSPTKAMVETFEIKVESDGVKMAWENTMVRFKVKKQK